ncbi:unnamed protein product [Aureobasidium mustum]|uniref:Uncharacterized protein n=1 Tax=Aureobasidium mustum TaxID=2773714 RepID=A0A9N8JJ74_9PEZI|nr:unnamed protein product [Aureobasidium mustum]
MEKLAKSDRKVEKKLSRSIARRLVKDSELSRSYRIRAHLALALLVCARDDLREAEEAYAETHSRIPPELHAKMQAELQVELRAIREAYKGKETGERTAVEGENNSVEDASASALTATAQLSAGSEEHPIDLTVEHDSTPYGNTSGKSCVNLDDKRTGKTDVISTGFSLWSRVKVICIIRSRLRALLTTFLALFFIRPLSVYFIQITISLSSTTEPKISERETTLHATISGPEYFYHTSKQNNHIFGL